jgi:hypothetical protein
MRLSDAGLRRLKTKAVYPDHRFPPWPTEDATPRSLEPNHRPTPWLTEDAPRDRSNRLLDFILAGLNN